MRCRWPRCSRCRCMWTPPSCRNRHLKGKEEGRRWRNFTSIQADMKKGYGSVMIIQPLTFTLTFFDAHSRWHTLSTHTLALTYPRPSISTNLWTWGWSSRLPDIPGWRTDRRTARGRRGECRRTPAWWSTAAWRHLEGETTGHKLSHFLIVRSCT